ncbi:hypothetical protein FCIRC_2999 [Fusarium circinatum]|uniref:DUF7888 domain-containing protein n=1 Tax=Fusarium circinatum TaxID=48490 RepID=A0A8H5X7L3_FUSCI|nr:hypothetical protein FCIRC_2999 [Fusarium circinatum]
MPSFTKVVAAVAGCSAIANGAVIPAENGLHTTTLQTRDTAKSTGHILSKREPVTIAILTAAGTAAATAIVNEAVKAAAAFIGNISNFDAGREAFTVQTTESMMANNPDPERFQAAACYNKAFSVADPANIDGQSSVEFRLGILNNDYECMYIAAPNQFFTEGDGGLINRDSLENLRHRPAPPKTLASSRGLHQDRFALEGSTLFTCPAPVSTIYTPWTPGVDSYTDEDGNGDETMSELLEMFHRVEQQLERILAVWDEISGIMSKISKSVKSPFPGSGILLAIFAIITICKTRLKNCFSFFVKQAETAMNSALEHLEPTN